MKRIEYFKLFSQILNPTFNVYRDKNGIEFVLPEDNSFFLEDIAIDDKTAFEAVESHIHLLDKITKPEFEDLTEIASVFCQHYFNKLKQTYPTRIFVVYVTIDINESMILRFHQKWHDEKDYYSEDDFDLSKVKIIKITG